MTNYSPNTQKLGIIFINCMYTKPSGPLHGPSPGTMKLREGLLMLTTLVSSAPSQICPGRSSLQGPGTQNTNERKSSDWAINSLIVRLNAINTNIIYKSCIEHQPLATKAAQWRRVKYCFGSQVHNLWIGAQRRGVQQHVIVIVAVFVSNIQGHKMRL